ncbi:MAG: right-handed parallel beta-helix repeat-containing protein, partial [Desulfovibrio sp.]|nr:right-handed parallel beta-helix repeat-containing protein [Desulfovibrio sp.]
NGIEIRRSKNVVIADCLIEGFRRKGVVIDEGCENVVVTNCVIRWTGEAGRRLD